MEDNWKRDIQKVKLEAFQKNTKKRNKNKKRKGN